MKCPFCGFVNDKVVDSRESKEGDVIRRRRECLECERRFTSYERIDEIPWVLEEDWPAVRAVMRDMSTGTRPNNVNANQLSPRASLTYNPINGTVFHAGFARNFTPPTQVIADCF